MMNSTLSELLDDERAQYMAMPWYIHLMIAGIGLIVLLIVLSEAGVLPP